MLSCQTWENYQSADEIHEQKKPFQCEACDFTTGQKGHLKQHFSIVHERGKQYECKICHGKFSHKSDLIRHTTMIHEQNQHYQCQICKHITGDLGQLKHHIERVHLKQSTKFESLDSQNMKKNIKLKKPKAP